ncbi:hypothetical protein [Streptomyces sp. WM6372]|uniref:hypothetical protein n=1 Tax=Streptomyces sp. WM6372 TaxID=1415555 RepID=UPI0006AE1657|nr:hypothetical protein [Streptomyces sp. WM6372]
MNSRDHKRFRRTRSPGFDPTYGDRPLAAALEDLRLGRWQGPRELLRGTRHDWDRRTHRIRLLAQTAAGSRTVESWQIAEPHDTDALALRADTDVMRLFCALAQAPPQTQRPPDRDAFDRNRLHHAARSCFRAADACPADPMPWISLLTLSRLYGGGHPDTGLWWAELRARDRNSREGHHQMLRHVSARWHGSHGRMYDFARDVAVAAPPGSPLAVLTQAARVEHYRELIRTEGRASLGLSFHWTHEAVAPDLDATLARWIAHRAPVEYAQDVADLNLLAHGLVFAGRINDATSVFHHLGDRPTAVPWSYCGDPRALFTQSRKQALA